MMGLDMYLSAKRYIWKSDDRDNNVQDKLNEVMKDDLPDGMRVQEITVDAMYWRKANAIHGWFVQNCQEGEDDCREYYVDREQIEELRTICKATLDGKDEGELEPTEGFFFGSYEKDEWYYKDLQETVEGLDKVLTLPNSYEFYYRSSW
jgi:hypothetical protein